MLSGLCDSPILGQSVRPVRFTDSRCDSVKLRKTILSSQKFEFLNGKKNQNLRSAVLIAFEVTGSQGLSFFYFLFVFKVLIICFDQTGVQNLTDLFSIVSPPSIIFF